MLLGESCKSCKKKSKGKLLLQALCWYFCSLGSASVVKNKLLAVPCLACTNALCINALRASYLLCPAEGRVEECDLFSILHWLPALLEEGCSQFLAVWMVNNLPWICQGLTAVIKTISLYPKDAPWLPAHPKLRISCCSLFEIFIITIWHSDVTTELQLIRKIRGNKWKIKWYVRKCTIVWDMNFYIVEIQGTSISFCFKKKSIHP